jgi:hypothetical protein
MKVVFKFTEIVIVFALFTLPIMSIMYVASILIPGYLESAPARVQSALSLSAMEMGRMGSPADSDNLPEFMHDMCQLVYRVTYLSTILLLHPLLCNE